MIIKERNHYENTLVEIRKTFANFNENQCVHAARVVCNYIKRQAFDIYEVHISKGDYLIFESGYYTYSNVVACKEIIYLTFRID